MLCLSVVGDESMVAQAPVSTAGGPLRILVSDQDEQAREALRRCLQRRHYELYEAGSGREALHILRRQVVHVLVSAVDLPDTTGFDVARGLRELDRWVPFILTVSELNKEVFLRALLARAFTVIQKPIDDWLFQSTLDHLVGRWYRMGVPPVREGRRSSWRWSVREEKLL